jgi:hypothetical protein
MHRLWSVFRDRAGLKGEYLIRAQMLPISVVPTHPFTDPSRPVSYSAGLYDLQYRCI